LLLNRLVQWGKPPLDRLAKIVKDPKVFDVFLHVK
jgi:hypothetical protein